jgi:hypothetical protein
MSAVAVSLITLAFVFGGALLGMFLRATLPEHHFDSDSKDVVKLGMGLVATMAALVLGLLIASAKSSFDTQNAELTEMSSKVVLLDRLMAHYGPESKEVRDVLRAAVVRVMEGMNTRQHSDPFETTESSTSSEVLYDKIRELPVNTDAQRAMQVQAINISLSLAQTRWLMFEQNANSISVPMLAVLIFWLTIIFVSFGLFAPPNATVIATLFVSALSVSGAIFLILEMYTPYAGLIHVSSAPLRVALAHLGR